MMLFSPSLKFVAKMVLILRVFSPIVYLQRVGKRMDHWTSKRSQGESCCCFLLKICIQLK